MAEIEEDRQTPTPRTGILILAVMGIALVVIGVLLWGGLRRLRLTDGGALSAIPVLMDYPAPELTLTDLQGKNVSLRDYHGQFVLVNHWATWCPPCKEEMPVLQAYYESHKDQGFTIVAIEAGQPVAEVADFVEEYGLTFPVWTDARLMAIAAFRNPGLPSSYLIDRKGMVRMAWAGAISLETLEEYVTPLIEE
jgi:peroxiredoxin